MLNDISQTIWSEKYKYVSPDGKVVDNTVEDTWRRVARALSSIEVDKKHWENIFYNALEGFKFIPAGRILTNAGTSRDKATMLNCYVSSTIEDSMESIFDVLKEAVLTQKQGGGIGFDFSTLRPGECDVKGTHVKSSGPLSFMKIFDASCRTIRGIGNRRGAQMAIMRCDHPDIEKFVTAKHDGELQMFNMSVAVTDKFMAAVKSGSNWDLTFNNQTFKTIRARDLWNLIMQSTYDYAEPGVLFIDRVNHFNNLYYCETITTTNPCGEVPLPPNGSCLLGSINLTKFVLNPFTDKATINYNGMSETLCAAVRMLDNVVDLSKFPTKEQEREEKLKRRIGIGMTGLANAMAYMRIKYGSEESVKLTSKIVKNIKETVYEASADLAKEKGAFKALDTEKYLLGQFVSKLPKSILDKIKAHGIRNSHLTSIAPTGTISLLAGNISSGIEPIFLLSYTRKIRNPDDTYREENVEDYAYAEWRKLNPFQIIL